MPRNRADTTRPPANCRRPLQTVNKVYFFDLCCKSLAEFRRPQTAEEGQIVFSGGVYVGKHTPQAASVRAKASARRGLHPLEKMLAFLRSVSKFFDTLTRPPANCRWPLVISLPYFRLKNASLPRYCATSPSSSSMRSSWLYLATRSVAAGRTGLDLAGVGDQRNIGDGGVFGLTGAVGDHGGITGPVGHLDGVQGLGQGADLVDLDEDGVGNPLLEAHPSGARCW